MPTRDGAGAALHARGRAWTRAQLEALPGLCLHDLMLLPLDRLRRFFDR
jgi:excinuclease ABC subunit A